MDKKILIFLFVGMLLINFLSAIDIPTVQRGQPVDLIQFCPTCTYVNLSSVTLPNNTQIFVNDVMVKNGNTYTYAWSDTFQIGEYIYFVFGDKGGNTVGESLTFTVTPTGEKDVMIFYIVAYVILFGIVIFGFSVRNEWITVLGGLGLLFMGIYTLNSGIGMYKNSTSEILSWITIGLGAIISIVIGIELIEENL